MNAKKQRDKNRRRASKLAQQAWNAADDGQFDLAVKIIRRAVEQHPANPLLWHDQGTLQLQLHQIDAAAFSFQNAIQMAPDFAEAYASLAAVRARQGHLDQAVPLQREAVRHAPDLQRHRNALASYEALLTGGCDRANRSDLDSPERPGEGLVESEPGITFSELAASIDSLPWSSIESHLTTRGYAHLPGLLDAAQCASLREMFDQHRLFAKTVTMNKHRFGRGVYRYFAAPIPALVDAVRWLVYPHAARIANGWQRLLPVAESYPAEWTGFRARCAAAGQTTPSPLMLRYEAGGFNAPHRDIRGAVFFPLQLVVVLSARAGGSGHDPCAFGGGDFLFCDQPERKPSDRRAVPAGLGDAVLFCTRERLVRVGDVYGLCPVKHGLDRVTSGIRYALGVPFHELE
jgi:hypothetical protein